MNKWTISSITLLTSLSLFYVYKYYRNQSMLKLKREISTSLSQQGKVTNDDEQAFLVKEQLSRNYSFLGDKQDLVCNAFVIIVGCGGVGSHAAHMLLRSGVKRLRLIDFDQVTLSSLNRHAVATRKDVGTPKVECMKKHFLQVLPTAEIETCVAMFSEDSAVELLSGNPDFILDCIDNVKTKTDLLAYCHENKLKVMSSMGSGAKCDPTRIQIADISETFEDPLARATRRGLRTKNIFSGIPVVYSTEKPGLVGLLPLEESKVNEAQEFAALPDFRARILPVLGTLPALFGNTMATYVLTQLANWPSEPLVIKARSKTYEKLWKDVTLKYFKSPTSPSSPILSLNASDIGFIFEEIWRGRSALSGSFDKLVLIKWDPSKPVYYGNLICLTRQEAQMHSDLDFNEIKSFYPVEFLEYVEKRLEKEKLENHWRLFF